MIAYMQPRHLSCYGVILVWMRHSMLTDMHLSTPAFYRTAMCCFPQQAARVAMAPIALV